MKSYVPPGTQIKISSALFTFTTRVEVVESVPEEFPPLSSSSLPQAVNEIHMKAAMSSVIITDNKFLVFITILNFK